MYQGGTDSHHLTRDAMDSLDLGLADRHMVHLVMAMEYILVLWSFVPQLSLVYMS